MITESFIVKQATFAFGALALAGITWAASHIWASTETLTSRVDVIETKQDSQAEVLKEMREDIKELLRRK